MQSHDDPDCPRVEPIPRRRTARTPDEDLSPECEPLENPDPELLRAVFMVPDGHWGISAVAREDHPGLCVREQGRRATLLKGGSSETGARYPHVLVEPTAENGLTRLTRFFLEPRHLRLRQVRLYFPQRHLGYLDSGRFQTVLEELARLFPEV